VDTRNQHRSRIRNRKPVSPQTVGQTVGFRRLPGDPGVGSPAECRKILVAGRQQDCPPYSAQRERGVTTIQLLVILVPVLFGFIGFAVDLGQLYLIRGELKVAANSMALAAAQKLIGTDQGITDATNAAHLAIDNSSGFGNKYNFGGLAIGQTNGFLTSSAPDPSYFATLQDAITGANSGGGGGADSRHARVTITADAPLTFWRFLPLATDGKVSVAAQAVAGISAPLCTACGIENFAIAALDVNDTTDFGFVADTQYTLGYSCTGVPTPAGLAGAPQRLAYILLNRLNASTTVFTDENAQMFRIGAGGLPGNTDSTQACFSINNTETIWVDAIPAACAATVNSPVTSGLCGLDARFEPSPQSVCQGIPDVSTLSGIYNPDTDTSSIDAYASYAGNGRRVITIPIVDTLNPTGSMTVLGFRQFLVEPNPNLSNINPADQDGRFIVLYIGSVVPVQQGRFDGCQISAGPGKVVLHQ
jgi:Flp pilus assembly protein TadG